MPPDATADPGEDSLEGPEPVAAADDAAGAVVGVEDFDDELQAASSRDRTTTTTQEYGHRLTSITTGRIHPRFTAIVTR
jgi:hypothetical protein